MAVVWLVSVNGFTYTLLTPHCLKPEESDGERVTYAKNYYCVLPFGMP